MAITLLDEAGHDALDHTGLTGVGGGGGGLTEAVTASRTAGNLTTTSTTFIDATDLSVTLTTAAVRCLVLFSAVAQISTTGQVDVDLVIDGTRVNASYAHGMMFMGSNNANIFTNVGFTYLTDVLSAASHTLKIQWRTTAGTGTLHGSTAQTPAILTVIETGLTA